MKQTSFAKYLTQFMVNYLVDERGYSRNTVSAYRESIILMLTYMREVHRINADRIEFKDITRGANNLIPAHWASENSHRESLCETT